MVTVQQWTGREIKMLRSALRMTVDEFAERLGVSRRSIIKWEQRGITITPLPNSQAILDTALMRAHPEARNRFGTAFKEGGSQFLSDEGAGGSFASGQLSVSGRPDEQFMTLDEQSAIVGEPHASGGDEYTYLVGTVPGFSEEDVEKMLRRTFILGLGAVLGVPTSPFAQESLRHSLTDSMIEDRASAMVEEWREIVLEYGVAYNTVSPKLLQDSLRVDLISIQQAMSRSTHSSTHREFRRAAALLAAFMGQTVANLGDIRESRRWWRTAKRLADESGDPDARVWIRGREIVRALFEGRPDTVILRCIDEAAPMIATVPVSALPEVLSGTAQALAFMGRRKDAETALDRFRDVYAELPSSVVAGGDSIFSWGEERLRCTESYVYSYLGDMTQADEAQSRALAIYPASFPRGPAQIELHRALCLVRAGDVATGVGHALSSLGDLPREHYVRPVVDMAQKVLTVLPIVQRQREDVIELRELLAASS